MTAIKTKGAEGHAHDLMHVSGQLIGLMRKEVDLLHDMRIRDIEALQADKESLAADYCRLAQEMHQEESALKALPETLKAELRLLEAQFAKAAEENQMALKAAMDANSRLFEIVAAAVREHQTNNSQYGANAQIGTNAASKTLASVSLDESL